MQLPVSIRRTLGAGIVLALLSSYMFTRAIPLYFVGTLVAKAVMLELGPVLTGMALAGRVGATRASISTYLIPVVAVLLGVIVLSERVHPLSLAGSALVLLGAWLGSRRGR